MNKGQAHIVYAISGSFETEFQPFIAELRRCNEDVEKEIGLAKAQADYQDLQLQLVERKAAFSLRKYTKAFFSRANKEFEASAEWRIQRDERRSSKYSPQGSIR